MKNQQSLLFLLTARQKAHRLKDTNKAPGSFLRNAQVPKAWTDRGFVSMKPLGSWLRDLTERLSFLQSWITNGPPKCYWMSGFFFPQARIWDAVSCTTVFPDISGTAKRSKIGGDSARWLILKETDFGWWFTFSGIPNGRASELRTEVSYCGRQALVLLYDTRQCGGLVCRKLSNRWMSCPWPFFGGMPMGCREKNAGMQCISNILYNV